MAGLGEERLKEKEKTEGRKECIVILLKAPIPAALALSTAFMPASFALFAKLFPIDVAFPAMFFPMLVAWLAADWA